LILNKSSVILHKTCKNRFSQTYLVSKKYIYIVQVTRQLSIDIVNDFVEQGAEIRLITGVVESNYKALDSKVKVTSFIKYNNSSSFKRLFTGTWFTICALFFLLFSGRKKELILVTTPPFIIFLGWFFKKIRNQKYHLIIWDLYPDVIINFGLLKKTSLTIRIWANMNKKCFSNAETIFTLGKHLSDAIKQYTTKEPVVIQNWTNIDFIKPMIKAQNHFAIQHQLTDKFTVMYSGNLGMTHNIEALIDAAEALKNNTQVHFVIIGEGEKKTKIRELIKEKKLTNVLLLPYQNKEMLPHSLSCADVGVITLSAGAENISVPSKTYYTLAAGSAILAIAPFASELGLLIEKYDCGEIFSGCDINEIANFIGKLQQDPGLLNQYKTNARLASKDFTCANAQLFLKSICKN